MRMSRMRCSSRRVTKGKSFWIVTRGVCFGNTRPLAPRAITCVRKDNAFRLRLFAKVLRGQTRAEQDIYIERRSQSQNQRQSQNQDQNQYASDSIRFTEA